MTCTRGCSYSFMYSWWWVRWTLETCRVILQYKKYLHTISSCWILLTYSYDAWNHEYKTLLNYVISYKFRKTWIYERKNWILPIIIFHNSTLRTLAALPHETYKVSIPLELYIFFVWEKFYIFWHVILLGFNAVLTDKFCGNFEGSTPLRDVVTCYKSTRRHVSEDFNNTTAINFDVLLNVLLSTILVIDQLAQIIVLK
jgi:hypothetical protein